MCLGRGKLKDRMRVDLYADRKGNVSQTQTIFGIDLREEIYDYGNSDYEDDPDRSEEDKKKDYEEARQSLIESGTDYLKDKQVLSEATIEIPDGDDYRIGSIVSRKEARAGVSVTARVDKVVVTLYSTGDREIQATLTDESLEWRDN